MLYFSSNLPPGGGFLMLDAKLAVSGTSTSQTGLAEYLNPILLILDSFFCAVVELFQVRYKVRQDLISEPDLKIKCLQYTR
uniref:Uncharacterized protein n=1 Tax=Solanum tuberosum TaxID=4113 RepID=M1DLK5_SOLTU